MSVIIKRPLETLKNSFKYDQSGTLNVHTDALWVNEFAILGLFIFKEQVLLFFIRNDHCFTFQLINFAFFFCSHLLLKLQDLVSVYAGFN